MLRITQANISGFSAPNDQGSGELILPSAYEAVDSFSVDIIFEGKYEQIDTVVDPQTGESSSTVSYVYQYATDVTSSYDWNALGIVFSKPNAYTVRLTGPAETVFPNQFYKFKMTDYSEQILPADTTEPFFGLIHYQMPSPTFTMKTYPFAVTIPATYGSGSTVVENTSMDQWFYWKYQVAVANIAAITARGLK